TPIPAFPFSDQPYGPAYTDETSPAVSVSCDATANTNARNGAWYSFTPAVNGVLLCFENSINPTNFTVFTSPCNAPVQHQGADESTSGVRINNLIGGTPYLLLVSYDAAVTTSTSNQPYNFSIQFIAAPPNDVCTTATNLNTTGLPFADTVTARAAGGDAG